MNEKNLFDEYGLSVDYKNVDVGQRVCLYGMITNFLTENIDNLVVEINNYIIANINVPSEEHLETLKSRSMEYGIFVSNVISTEPMEVDVQTIVFGKKKELDA